MNCTDLGFDTSVMQQTFRVHGYERPLLDGETQRAIEWASASLKSFDAGPRRVARSRNSVQSRMPSAYVQMIRSSTRSTTGSPLSLGDTRSRRLGLSIPVASDLAGYEECYALSDEAYRLSAPILVRPACSRSSVVVVSTMTD